MAYDREKIGVAARREADSRFETVLWPSGALYSEVAAAAAADWTTEPMVLHGWELPNTFIPLYIPLKLRQGGSLRFDNHRME